MTSGSDGEAKPHGTTLHAARKAGEGIGEGASSFEAKKTDLTVSWAGPVPPPEVLASYAKISPDFPERIFHLVEAEANYRKSQYEKLEKSARRAQITSLLVMAALFIFGAVSSGLLLMRGEDAIAVVVGVAPPLIAILASAVTFFVARRKTTGRV